MVSPKLLSASAPIDWIVCDMELLDSPFTVGLLLGTFLELSEEARVKLRAEAGGRGSEVQKAPLGGRMTEYLPCKHEDLGLGFQKPRKKLDKMMPVDHGDEPV